MESIYESGDSFKPTKHDYNSSDSNLSTPTDDSAKRMDKLLSEKNRDKSQTEEESEGSAIEKDQFKVNC